MKKQYCLRFLVVSTIIVSAIFLWRGVQVVRAQQDIASGIQQTLTEAGVPVESVSVKSGVLGLGVGEWGVQIVLRVPSTRQGSPGIPEYVQRVVAEVTKASVTAKELQSYELRILDDNDKLTSVEKNTIDASGILSTREASLESQEVAALLKGEFSPQMEIKNLEVVASTKGIGQRLELLVEVGSVQEANALIQSLGLRRQIEEKTQVVNEKGAMITECHLRIEDLDGNPMLNLVVDIQDGRWDWWAAEGIEHLPGFPGPPSLPDGESE